jgi:hypothetical protein
VTRLGNVGGGFGGLSASSDGRLAYGLASRRTEDEQSGHESGIELVDCQRGGVSVAGASVAVRRCGPTRRGA